MSEKERGRERKREWEVTDDKRSERDKKKNDRETEKERESVYALKSTAVLEKECHKRKGLKQ